MSNAVVEDVGQLFESLEELVELDDRVSDAALDDRLEGLLAELTGSSTRPAAAKLSADQARTLVWLLDGMEDRDEVLAWMRAVSMQSLGRIEDEWFGEIVASSPMQSALLGRPWGTLTAQVDELPPGFASNVRRGLLVDSVLPAYRRAHREFRWSAGERVEPYENDPSTSAAREIEPTRQLYPGMRPALGQLGDRGRWALAKLLAGLEDEDELVLWIQHVTAATRAELDEDALTGAYFDSSLRPALLGDEPRDRFVRRVWGAERLLPALNRATREVADRAGEVLSEEHADAKGGSIT